MVLGTPKSMSARIAKQHLRPSEVGSFNLKFSVIMESDFVFSHESLVFVTLQAVLQLMS